MKGRLKSLTVTNSFQMVKPGLAPTPELLASSTVPPSRIVPQHRALPKAGAHQVFTE